MKFSLKNAAIHLPSEIDDVNTHIYIIDLRMTAGYQILSVKRNLTTVQSQI